MAFARRATAAAESRSDKTPSPLFPVEDPDKVTYAEDIARVNIYRVALDQMGRERRMLIPRHKIKIEINPWKTTDQDIVDAFKPGTYYLEPIGIPGKKAKLAGGHNVIVPSDDDLYGAEEEEEGEEEPPPPPPPSPPPSAANEQVVHLMSKVVEQSAQATRDMLAVEREHASQKAEMYTGFAQSMMKTMSDTHRSQQPPGEIVETLREQIHEIRKRALRDEEDLRRHHANTLQSMQTQIDDLRRSHREELARKDRDYDDLRRKTSNDQDDTRRQWKDEVQEIRRASNEEISRLRTELQKLRDQFEKEVYDLQKENIKLERELAIAEANASTEESEPPPPPSPANNAWAAVAPAVQDFAKVVVQKFASAPTTPAQQQVPPTAYAPPPMAAGPMPQVPYEPPASSMPPPMYYPPVQNDPGTGLTPGVDFPVSPPVPEQVPPLHGAMHSADLSPQQEEQTEDDDEEEQDSEPLPSQTALG